MTPGAYRYALDPTGLNPDNLVIAEEHKTTANSVRAVAPKNGAFFAESMLVYDGDTSNQLVLGTDYKCVELLQDATLKYGKEICVLLLIINPDVSSVVRITYQAVGGQFQYDGSAIANLYETVIKDNRPVDWENILNRPLEYPPTMHNHLLEQVYGFEPVVAAIERVRNAILLSDVPAFEAVIDWMNGRANQINSALSDLTSIVQEHNDSRNNPHVVTKAQVNLGKVENNAVVGADEIVGDTPTHKYVTHDRLISFFDWKAGDLENKTIETFVEDQVAGAVYAHEAHADPHPQYMTSSEVDTSIAAHEAKIDPHPQYMTSAEVSVVMTDHTVSVDPHPQYATDTALSTAFASHTSEADPHSQYLDKLSFASKVGQIGNTSIKEYVDSSTSSVTAASLGIHNFKVISRGYKAIDGTQGFYKNNTLELYGARSHMLVVIRLSDGEITFKQTYDVSGNGINSDGRNAQTLAVDLNTVDSGHLVVLFSADDPKTNRMTSGLSEAVYRCGGSRAVFGSPRLVYRGAYVLIGAPGCGEGNGIEFYRGEDIPTGDPNAVIELGFQIVNGVLASVGGVGSQFFAYLNRDEFQEKLGDISTTTLKEYVDNTASTKEPVLSAGTATEYYRGDKTWQTLNKAAVGLANVNNTSDLNKPVSTATQTALDAKENAGVASSLVSTHEASVDPHPQYMTSAEVGGEFTSHVQESNPHSQYALVEDISNALSVKEDLGTASSLVAAHEAHADPHPQYRHPPAAVSLFYAFTPPDGWLEADGSWKSKTTYARLYDRIKDIPEVTTNGDLFKLPDLRGEFLRGWDNGRGIDAGRQLGSLQLDLFSSHTHRLKTDTGTVTEGTQIGLTDTGIWTDAGGADSLNSEAISSDGQILNVETYETGGSETRPRNIALLVCISY